MSTAVIELIERAEAARGGGSLADGLAAASQAWAEAEDDSQRRRAGLLLTHFYYRSGALLPLIEVGQQVLPLARAGSEPGELFDLLRQVSLAGCDTGRLSLAFGWAQEAHTLALHLGNHGRLALAVNALACCFERMGDPWQAERLMLEALVLAREHGERHPLFVTLNNIVAVLIGMYHLQRDAVPLEEAREALRRALPYAEDTLAMVDENGEPFYRVFAAGNLGEVLLHLGRLDRARALLEANATLAAQIGASTQVWRIQYSLGELELFEGRVEAAWVKLEEVLGATGSTDVPIIRMRIHHALWRAASELQRPADALQHLEQYVALERRRSVQQLQAQSQLLVTRNEVEQVQAEARRDTLTRLSNRADVARRWPGLIEAARAIEAPLAVAMIDLDHFKRVNDRFGHAVGDSVLVAVAGILQVNTRSSDLAARIGGEEFLIVLSDTLAGTALEVCERLRQRVAAHDWSTLAPDLTVTLSVGLTTAPPYDAAALMARADAALYRAKAEGRNRVVED